jgi:ERCC4-related helicase
VLFVAPTKPLVKQQYDSCREIMGIPVRAALSKPPHGA